MFITKTEIKALLIVLFAVFFLMVEDRNQQILFSALLVVLVFSTLIVIPYTSILRNKKYVKHVGTIAEVDLLPNQSSDASFFYVIKYTLNEIEHLHTCESKYQRKVGEKVRFYVNSDNTEKLQLEDDIMMGFIEGLSFTFIFSAILLYHILKK